MPSSRYCESCEERNGLAARLVVAEQACSDLESALAAARARASHTEEQREKASRPSRPAPLNEAGPSGVMGAHLIDGEFQSDKYPTTPRGKVPLSVKDSTAQDLLWEYAQRRRPVDAEFADDLETALRSAGYTRLRGARPATGKALAHKYGFKPMSDADFRANVDRECAVEKCPGAKGADTSLCETHFGEFYDTAQPEDSIDVWMLRRDRGPKGLPHDYVVIGVFDSGPNGSKDTISQCARCRLVRHDYEYDGGKTSSNYPTFHPITDKGCTRGDMTEERAMDAAIAPRNRIHCDGCPVCTPAAPGGGGRP